MNITLRQLEIFAAIATLGHVTRAAEALGLERSHLYRKMKALGVNVKE